VKCKVKRSFGLHQSFVAGEVREFTPAEAQRLQHLIEPVNSTDTSKNKMFKKGRRKTK